MIIFAAVAALCNSHLAVTGIGDDEINDRIAFTLIALLPDEYGVTTLAISACGDWRVQDVARKLAQTAGGRYGRLN